MTTYPIHVAIATLVLTVLSFAAPDPAHSAPQGPLAAQTWAKKDGPWGSRYWRNEQAMGSESHLLCLDEAPGVARWAIIKGPGTGMVVSMEGKFDCDTVPVWVEDVVAAQR